MGLICYHHTLSPSAASLWRFRLYHVGWGVGEASERIRPRSYMPRALGARGLHPCRELWELAACTFYIGARGGWGEFATPRASTTHLTPRARGFQTSRVTGVERRPGNCRGSFQVAGQHTMTRLVWSELLQ